LRSAHIELQNQADLLEENVQTDNNSQSDGMINYCDKVVVNWTTSRCWLPVYTATAKVFAPRHDFLKEQET
jgi:hypothetical protein